MPLSVWGCSRASPQLSRCAKLCWVLVGSAVVEAWRGSRVGRCRNGCMADRAIGLAARAVLMMAIATLCAAFRNAVFHSGGFVWPYVGLVEVEHLTGRGAGSFVLELETDLKPFVQVIF